MNKECFEQVKCLICDSDKFVDFREADQNLNLSPPLKVARCVSCGLLFLNPRPSLYARMEIFAGRKPKALDIYLKSLANYGAVTRSRLSLFTSRIEGLKAKHFGKATIKVLDVGASSGEFMEAGRIAGWEMFGVEPSADGVRTGKEKGLNILESPAEELPFLDGTFDLVHSNHVFEHLGDPLTAAKEAQRVLRPGGLVFIEVPNQFDNIQFFRYRLTGRIPVRERNIRSIHHLVFFSRKSLYRLLREAGFENIKIYNQYGKTRRGLGYVGSLLVRLIGLFYLGAPVIQAVAKKKS